MALDTVHKPEPQSVDKASVVQDEMVRAFVFLIKIVRLELSVTFRMESASLSATAWNIKQQSEMSHEAMMPLAPENAWANMRALAYEAGDGSGTRRNSESSNHLDVLKRRSHYGPHTSYYHGTAKPLAG